MTGKQIIILGALIMIVGWTGSAFGIIWFIIPSVIGGGIIGYGASRYEKEFHQ